MPYVERPDARIAPDDNRTIWRYLGFEKFVAMLNSRSLYFVSVERLKTHDPFEGYVSPNAVEALVRSVREGHPRGEAADNELREFLRQGNLTRDRIVLVNCWHENAFESAAMWKLYADRGVAIQSTTPLLKASVGVAQEDVFLEEVAYVHHPTMPVTGEEFKSVFPQATRKGMSFSHEREIRAMCFDLEFLNAASSGSHGQSIGGLKVAVDLEQLLQRVIVAPTSPEWFRVLVEDVLARYGINKTVTKSALDAIP
jgi:hypothetical protein